MKLWEHPLGIVGAGVVLIVFGLAGADGPGARQGCAIDQMPRPCVAA